MVLACGIGVSIDRLSITLQYVPELQSYGGWLGCASLQLLAGWSICALLPIQIQITD